MFEKLKLLRDLYDKLQTWDIPGKLEDGAGYLDEAAAAMRDLAATLRKYTAPQAVAATAAADAAGELIRCEAFLVEWRQDVTARAARGAAPDMADAAIDPGFVLALIDLCLKILDAIRHRQGG